MQSTFVKPNDPVLVKKAAPIPPEKIRDEDVQHIIEALLDVAYGHRVDQKKPTVVGLAAPQIGMSERVIVVDIGAEKTGGLSNLRVYINPEITWMSKEKEEWCEGCWSTGNVCGVVARSK